MGTAKDWIQVAIAGCFWGGLMFFLTSVSRLRKSKAKLHAYFIEGLTWALMGLVFGILDAFHLKEAFQPPLVYILAVAFIGGLIVGRLGRPKPQASKTQTTA